LRSIAQGRAFRYKFVACGAGLGFAIVAHLTTTFLRWAGLPPDRTLLDESLIGLVATIGLLTLFKSFEEQISLRGELQRVEERSRMAMDAANIGFWDWDVVEDKQVWSDSCRALIGVSRDDPTNFQVLMSSVHPDDREMLQTEIDKAIAEKKAYICEFRVVWPDGSMHWLAARGRAFYDATGRTIRMAGVSIDIDKRKVSEEKLHLQAEALEAAANSIVITEPTKNPLDQPRFFRTYRLYGRTGAWQKHQAAQFGQTGRGLLPGSVADHQFRKSLAWRIDQPPQRWDPLYRRAGHYSRTF
jgi:PAS domain S-box-containing protein